MVTQIDVLVVGAGPVGLTLANYLGQHGVRTLVIERNASTVHEPRAIGYDDETLRAIRAIGLEDAFSPHILPDIPIELVTGSGMRIASVHATGRPIGHSRFGTFYQPTLERVLAAGLDRFDSVDLCFEHTLLEFTQDHRGVDAQIEGPDGTARDVRARWMIGCDGASSGVREALGIKLVGSTYHERWLVVDCSNDVLGEQRIWFHCDPARPYLTIPAPGNKRRWEFLLLPGETAEEMNTDAAVRRLFRRHHDPQLAEIERRTVYTFHARMAEHYRQGRVLLAGDAAHLMPPFAGQGMNSGIRDATNLGWKLAAVLKGDSDDGLLYSYEAERRWHVKRMTTLAVGLGWFILPTNRRRARIRDVAARVINAIPGAPAYLSSGRLRPSPALGKAGLFVPSSRHKLPGKMLPQPDVKRLEDGATVPLDEVLGQGFVLLGLGEDPCAVDDELTALGRQLGARQVCISEQLAEFPSGPDVEQVNVASWLHSGFQRGTPRTLLVRPDRFVMAEVRGKARAAAAARIRKQLQLHPSPPRKTHARPQSPHPSEQETQRQPHARHL